MLTVTINGDNFNIPENWQEAAGMPAFRANCTHLLEALYVKPEDGNTYHQVLRVVLGYTQKQWNRLMRHFFSSQRGQQKIDESADALAELVSLVSWMWEGELTIAPFEHIDVEGQEWLMFPDGFSSMTFGELTDSYIHAQAFVNQLVEGEERLNMLVATLCRPERQGDYTKDPDWNGDRREPYNEHAAALRSKLLAGKHFPQKVLTLVYFLGSIKNFFSFFDLFDSDQSSPPVLEDFPGQSMIKNQHLLSEKAIFGNMASTKKANVHEVFQFLEEHHKDVKAEIERNKNRE